ncbi:MAG: UvrD-helicase domain-containing protein [Nitrospira sp.]|nr:UvrD-helicase domain-containing protein [Nitrospira sp.]
MSYLPDYENRRLAVTTFDKNIVVTAGAGTGKTTLLVDRIICLLMRPQDPLKITDIVALTFTNKAAGEMRSRLRKRLEGIVAYGCRMEDSGENRMLAEIIEEFNLTDNDVIMRAKNAISELEKAQICTMHSFAGFVLRFYPLEAGIDPGFKEDDGSAFEELFEKKWEEWLDVELSLSSPHRELWEAILNRTTLESLKEFVREICNESFPLHTLLKDSTGNDSDNEFQLWLRSQYAKIQELLVRYPKLRKVEKLLIRAGEIFECCIENRTPEISDDDSCSIPKDWIKEDFEEAVRIIKAAKRLSSADDDFFYRLSELCVPFAKSFRYGFTASGYISFDGLLAFSREILKNSPEVRDDLKRRFKAILIDEFQNTDPVQYEIGLYMAETSGGYETDWRKVRLEPGKLFIVGDPKQSIYSFRKADIEAYSYVREMVLAGNSGSKTDLSTNFRSNNRVIDVVNDLFSSMIKKRGLYQPEYVSLINRPGHEAVLPDQMVEFRLVEAGDDVTAPKAVRLEAEAIGRWLKEEAIGKKEIIGPDGAKLIVAPRHIAILLRKMTDVYAYLEVLRKYDIPYTVEGERHFYATQEVIDIVNLLRIIDNPGDSLAMTGVLRSPLGGLSDREIYELKRLSLFDYHTAELKDVNVGAVSELYKRLRLLKAEIGTKTVSDAVHLIFETLPVLEFAASSYNGEQAIANLIKIQKIAESLGDKADMTLKGFTALLEGNVADLQEEGESLLSEEAVNAVRIMSIHKAKGLEFPVVVLAGVHSSKKEGEDNISVVHDWSSNATGLKIDNLRNRDSVMINDKITIKDDEEQKRLLYVAMTRARESLIISGTMYGSMNRNCFMSMIKDVAGDSVGEESVDEIVLGRGRIKQTIIRQELLERYKAKEDNKRTELTGSKAFLTGYGGIEELAGLWERRAKNYSDTAGKSIFISPTKMEKESAVDDVPGTIGTRPAVDSVRGRALNAMDRAVLIGKVVHYILEHWDFRNDKLYMGGPQGDMIPGDVPEDLIARFMPQQTEVVISSVKEEIKGIMKNFLLSPAYKELKGAEIIGREVPFTMPWDGQVMEGFMDVIFKDGEGIYIADYKTDRVQESEMDNKAIEYSLSGRIYIEVVKRCLGINASGFKLIFLRAGKSVRINLA